MFNFYVCLESAHSPPYSDVLSFVDSVESFAAKVLFCGIIEMSAVEGALLSLDKAFDLSAQRFNLVGAAFADGVSTNSREFFSSLLNSDIFF